MIKSKFVTSIIVFSILMVITSIIKTQTRLVEKNINSYKNKISVLSNNLHEIQLDYHYLSSPKILERQINQFSDEIYITMDYSKIYLSLDDFLEEKFKTTKNFENEKEIK
ncbi:MAG: hypothetical protein CBD25_002565 [Candidatus Pelagibacter sp. TMED165]|nr:MAG: hypothetical protein CBD25_002565 [Candidatus Pelagibacter sp. TMED165]